MWILSKMSDFENVNFVKKIRFLKMWILSKMRFSKCEFLSQMEISKIWISVKNETLKMWISSIIEILEMWIYQRMRVWKCEFCQKLRFSKCEFAKEWDSPGVNSVFSCNSSEISEVLLLKIMFFYSFPVKSQRFFCLLAQNSSCPRNLGKNHTKSGQNQCPGNGNFDTGSWQGVPRYANSVLCNEKAKNWDDGDNNLRLEKIEFWLEFDAKERNLSNL